MSTELRPRQVAALTAAAERWDRSLMDVDGRTVRGLIQRGLVTPIVGTVERPSRYSHLRQMVPAITDVKINEAGRRALAEHLTKEGASR